MDQVQPIQPKHWGTLGTMLWGLALLVVFLVVQAVVQFEVARRGIPIIDEQQLKALSRISLSDGTAFSIAAIASALICVPLVLAVIKLKRGSSIREYLALEGVGAKILARWLALMAVCIVISDVVTFLVGRGVAPDFLAQFYASTKPIWLLWLALVITAPIFEEMFFRGFLYKGFAAGPIRPVGAVVVTALVWAVIHGQYDVYGVATIFFQGLLQGAARVATRSLVVPVAMHAETNIIAAAEAAFFSA